MMPQIVKSDKAHWTGERTGGGWEPNGASAPGGNFASSDALRLGSDTGDFCPGTSDQLQPLQARVPVLADDDVVVHGDAERLRHLDDRLRHLDVGARRRRVAGGMVVDEDDRGGGKLERA